ncbi:hypothetical protein Poli38472_011247 [Pythium oligandrum]|uniref:EGF-like domain-containing protein n=1 Tax=Pythium oligandrum TaxID=41045 RepID=A0A8K1CPX8_PYTOL|nr:hypothetical protein Poli38472_011247 [Pythium oligandrum]|eukprot:TMW67627.1 hypothetical protein Poli38472_011247 [Pythium oligandrum]
MLANCNGHGRCNTATKTCTCFEGYGAATDVAVYKAPDCSQRVCPAGPSWGGIPTDETVAHALAECSDMGVCDRSSGQCKCYRGYEGSACQRSTCLNGCSGHGRCVSMREMATITSAFPLSPAATYEGAEDTTTWDQNRIFGCLCDSSWAVGLGSGQRQQSEWFGPDCSLLRCPTGDDPLTAVDETDCNGKTATDSTSVGQPGNRCHVDCANRGICDYTSGTCMCFSGFYGSNCASLSPVKT